MKNSIEHWSKLLSVPITNWAALSKAVNWDSYRDAIAQAETTMRALNLVSPVLSPGAANFMIRALASKTLVYGGFVPSAYMDWDLQVQLAALSQKGISKDEVQRIVVEHYDEDNADRVSNIVDRLKASPDFKGQRRILDDALSAHRYHLDAIGYIPLVVLIEGVAIPWVKKVAPYLDELADMHDAFADVLNELRQRRLSSGATWDEEKELKQLIGQMKGNPTQRDIVVAINGSMSTGGRRRSAPSAPRASFQVDQCNQGPTRGRT
jgi:hypothetical protein